MVLESIIQGIAFENARHQFRLMQGALQNFPDQAISVYYAIEKTVDKEFMCLIGGKRKSDQEDQIELVSKYSFSYFSDFKTPVLTQNIDCRWDWYET